MAAAGVAVWAKWLKANGHNLAPLTGADHAVLGAIAACWDALPYIDRRGQAIEAVAALLPAMQQKCWPLARELIARSLDWGDRERVWRELEVWVLDLAQVPNLGGDHSRLFHGLREMPEVSPR